MPSKIAKRFVYAKSKGARKIRKCLLVVFLVHLQALTNFVLRRARTHVHAEEIMLISRPSEVNYRKVLEDVTETCGRKRFPGLKKDYSFLKNITARIGPCRSTISNMLKTIIEKLHKSHSTKKNSNESPLRRF